MCVCVCVCVCVTAKYDLLYLFFPFSPFALSYQRNKMNGITIK